MVTAANRYRFTVAKYEEMIHAGIFTEDDRVELLDGEILQMAAKELPHLTTTRRLNYWAITTLGRRVVVSVQDPVNLNDNSQPEPDLLLLHPRVDTVERKPNASDVFLAIEVADTTLRTDHRKVRRYAASGIPESWIFNCNRKLIEVHRDPGPDGYQSVTIIRKGEAIAPLTFPDAVLRWEDIFR